MLPFQKEKPSLTSPNRNVSASATEIHDLLMTRLLTTVAFLASYEPVDGHDDGDDEVDDRDVVHIYRKRGGDVSESTRDG